MDEWTDREWMNGQTEFPVGSLGRLRNALGYRYERMERISNQRFKQINCENIKKKNYGLNINNRISSSPHCCSLNQRNVNRAKQQAP